MLVFPFNSLLHYNVSTLICSLLSNPAIAVHLLISTCLLSFLQSSYSIVMCIDSDVRNRRDRFMVTSFP